MPFICCSSTLQASEYKNSFSKLALMNCHCVGLMHVSLEEIYYLTFFYVKISNALRIPTVRPIRLCGHKGAI